MQNKYFFAFILMTLIGCENFGASKVEKYREARTVMATIIKIDVCQSRKNENLMAPAYAAVWQRMEDIGSRMNVFDATSDVARINNSFQTPVTVGEDTYYVLERALYHSVATQGAFDITIWPLMELWKKAEADNILPTHEQILDVKSTVGIGHLELLGKNRVQRTNDGTQIDLGGIAKGYAIDEAARIFREQGINDFFIDAGGDIYAGGLNCEGKPWRVGIKDPEDQSQLIEIVHVSDKAVTTSGNYEQYFTILGKPWSHIINPNTGYPQKEVISATVIAPQAIDADALSTALTVFSGPAGKTYINTLSGEYASYAVERNILHHIKAYESNSLKNFQSENGERQ